MSLADTEDIGEGELLTEGSGQGTVSEKSAIIDNNQLYKEHCASVNKLDTSICAENDLINLDDIQLSDDEDTWLYTSPKNLSKEEKGMSPYKWLRKDVEDPMNHQLQIAKSALVSKLDELDILGHTQSNKLRTKSIPVQCEDTNKNIISLVDLTSDHVSDNEMDTVTEEPEFGNIGIEEINKNENPKFCDASDILERARQQEESLKLSSSKFFYEAARTFPRVNRLNSDQAYRSSNAAKPVSVETLCMYGKQNPAHMASIYVAQKKLLHSSPSPSPFGSTASLNLPHDLHRSSLPNLNRSYLSLRTKKSKRTSEPHIQCPLPIYPKTEKIGIGVKTEITALPKSTLRSSSNVYGESKTLPSSYRTKSKKSSISGNIDPLFSATRRGSSPSTYCQNTSTLVNPSRRESSPCVSSLRSPRKNNGMYSFHGGSVPHLQHTKAISVVPSEISNESQKEVISFRNKRQPLSSVHNYTPKHEERSVIQDEEELSKLNLPSKIPSPSIRSGIPVPSTQYTVDKSKSTNDNWSQDFY